MGFLDTNGLNYLWSKLKPKFDACLKKGAIFSSNAFVGDMSTVYISKLDNAWAALDKWSNTTVTMKIYNADDTLYQTATAQMINKLFNGIYDEYIVVPAGKYAVINVTFSNDINYPYGNWFISSYFDCIPKTISAKMYVRNGTSDYKWWNFSPYVYKTNGVNKIWAMQNNQQAYNMRQIEFTITAEDSKACWLSEIELWSYRTINDAVIKKSYAERLYYPLTAPQFIGDLVGNADTATADGNGDNISDTYAKKTDIPTGIPLIRSATFDGLAWSSQGDGTYTQTLTVQGVTANNIIFVTPTDAYKDTYITMNCEATSQGTNTVTFTCTNPQDASIVMQFIIFNS